MFASLASGSVMFMQTVLYCIMSHHVSSNEAGTSISKQSSQENHNSHTHNQQRSLQNLRDRTDELELIISSLTIFALFSLPGWLFENFASSYTHLSVALAVGSTTGMVVITGLC